MARPRTVSDEDLLDQVLTVIRAEGPDGATFSAVATATGMAASSLVQRFGKKQDMLRAALMRAWDRLDEATEKAAADAPWTSEGAVALLVALTAGYGNDSPSYADGLVLLREDLRDGDLRARGSAWGKRLRDVLNARLANEFPLRPPGRLMLSCWQGCLVWWAFDPWARRPTGSPPNSAPCSPTGGGKTEAGRVRALSHPCHTARLGP